LVGVGNIGRAVAGKAVGLGLQVMAFDPFIAVGTGELELVGLDELLRTSDFVSLHCPLNAATQALDWDTRAGTHEAFGLPYQQRRAVGSSTRQR